MKRHLLVAAALLVFATRPARADGEALRDVVEALKPEVARLRGLHWREELDFALLTREEVTAFFREEWERVPSQERALASRILRRRGLLRPHQELDGLVSRLHGGMVAGYYDPETKQLRVVRGGSVRTVRGVLFHELIHALEDQHLDFEARFRRFENDPDRLFAERCLREGSAVFSTLRFVRSRGGRRPVGVEPGVSGAVASHASPRGVPAFLAVEMLLPYELGFRLLALAVRDDLPEALARIHADPPVSQEQWLHPEKWLGGPGPRRDDPRSVAWADDLAAAAGEGWSLVQDRTQGELDLALYLDHLLRGGRPAPGVSGRLPPVTAEAARAAAGWDAGRLLVLEREGRPLGTVEAWAFDSPTDAAEAAVTIVAALASRDDVWWSPATWLPSPPAADVERTPRTLKFTGRHGPGRIRVSGDVVLVAEGFPKADLRRLWPVVRRTRFESRASANAR